MSKLADDVARGVYRVAKWNTRATQSPEPPSVDVEVQAREVVGTVFQNTAASPETLERVMIERISAALTTAQAKQKEVDEQVCKEVQALNEQCAATSHGQDRYAFECYAAGADQCSAAIRAGGKQ